MRGYSYRHLRRGPSQQGMQLVLNTLNLIKTIITLGKEGAGLAGFVCLFDFKEGPDSAMEENLKI